MPSIYLDLKLQAHRSGVYECLLFIIVLEIIICATVLIISLKIKLLMTW